MSPNQGRGPRKSENDLRDLEGAEVFATISPQIKDPWRAFIGVFAFIYTYIYMCVTMYIYIYIKIVL